MFNCKRKIALALAMFTMVSTNNCYIVKAYDNDGGYSTYLELINECLL